MEQDPQDRGRPRAGGGAAADPLKQRVRDLCKGRPDMVAVLFRVETRGFSVDCFRVLAEGPVAERDLDRRPVYLKAKDGDMNNILV